MPVPQQKVYRRPAGKMEDWTTGDFLNELIHRHGIRHTEYAVAKLLQVSPQTIYRYRANAGTFDDAVAARVAALLQVSPEWMLVWVSRERARSTDARAHWGKLLKRLAQSATAAAVLLAVQVALLADQGSALIFESEARAASASPLIHYANWTTLALVALLAFLARLCPENPDRK